MVDHLKIHSDSLLQHIVNCMLSRNWHCHCVDFVVLRTPMSGDRYSVASSHKATCLCTVRLKFLDFRRPFLGKKRRKEMCVDLCCLFSLYVCLKGKRRTLPHPAWSSPARTAGKILPWSSCWTTTDNSSTRKGIKGSTNAPTALTPAITGTAWWPLQLPAATTSFWLRPLDSWQP